MELITAKLISNKKLTDSIFELTISASKYRFQSGQHLLIQIPQTPEPKMAAFSIAADDRKIGSLRLFIRHLENSPTTEYLSKLKPHSTINITSARGSCLFKNPAKKDVFFFCTGTGLAQHISFISSNREKFPDVHMHLWVEVKNEGEIYLESELEVFKRESTTFDFEYIVQSPKAEWKGKSGCLVDHITSLVFDSQNTQVYLCGRPDMVNLADNLLQSRGLSPENIIFESY